MKTHTDNKPSPKMLEIYDAIMLMIEPELCTDVIDTLDDLYEGETPEQTAARGERYADAIKAFVELFEFLVKSGRNDLLEVREAVLGIAKSDDRRAAGKEIQDIEDSIQDA